MRFLFIGDIVGRPGREALAELLPRLRTRHSPDLVIANVENAASGFGITDTVAAEIQNAGVDVMTGGNHLWDKKGSEDYIAREADLVRPANYPEGTPGATYCRKMVGGTAVIVISLQGQVFMPPNDNPFHCLDALLEDLEDMAEIFLLDFHGEATSEKQAIAWYADGRVSAVVGTHTHVPTADERILPKGTAYVSDLGMTGPYDSIIGMRHDSVLRRFLTGMPSRFEVAKGDARLSGLLVDVDPATGRATAVSRVHERLEGGGA